MLVMPRTRTTHSGHNQHFTFKEQKLGKLPDADWIQRMVYALTSRAFLIA
jgi:hypothetical protein